MAVFGDGVSGTMLQAELSSSGHPVGLRTAYGAVKDARRRIFGEAQESYAQLPDFCRRLSLANPGSIIQIDVQGPHSAVWRGTFVMLAPWAVT